MDVLRPFLYAFLSERHFLIFWFAYASCIFLYQFPLHHDLMAASCAFQTEVCSYTENLPFVAATGMGFFQFYNISDFIYHNGFLLRAWFMYPQHLHHCLKHLPNGIRDHQIRIGIPGGGGSVDENQLLPLIVVNKPCRRIYG